MPDEHAVLTGHGPPARLDHPTAAARAGRGRAAFVDQMHADPGQLGFVFQHGDGPADLPLP
jgi:hypothetical protein